MSDNQTPSNTEQNGNSRLNEQGLIITEELHPEEIRWFYRDEGEKAWHAFNGYDSLRIETKFRELKASNSSESNNSSDDSPLIELSSETDANSDSSRERIIVRGGLYEVDVKERRCTPIYWTRVDEPDWRGNKMDPKDIVNMTAEVMRGTWFSESNVLPLDEEFSDKIEAEHLAAFIDKPFDLSQHDDDHKNKRTAVHQLLLEKSHVEWYDPFNVFLYQESTSLFIRQRLGLQKSGTRLYRGYSQIAQMDDKYPDITHLCFVIHGIGQKMKTGSIVKCCADLRMNCEAIKHKYFPDLDHGNERLEFLPVEWRSSLHLDGGTVDSITPGHLRGLRNLLNSSAMDIMYYTSPLYRNEITQSLQAELNRLFSMFCSRHPYFEANGGKVFIIAHSLGCVITYDIIMGWNPIHLHNKGYTDNQSDVNHLIQLPIAPEALHEEGEECDEILRQLEEYRKKVMELETRLLSLAETHYRNSPLTFRVDSFFCLGSPLSVFLALRGIRPNENGNYHHIIPPNVCNRLYNIYHPADPVAYRLEPLVVKQYSEIQPLNIHRYNALVKPPYSTIGLKPMKLPSRTKSAKKRSPSTAAPKERNPNEWLSNIRNRILSTFEDPPKPSDKRNLCNLGDTGEPAEKSANDSEPSLSNRFSSAINQYKNKLSHTTSSSQIPTIHTTRASSPSSSLSAFTEHSELGMIERSTSLDPQHPNAEIENTLALLNAKNTCLSQSQLSLASSDVSTDAGVSFQLVNDNSENVTFFSGESHGRCRTMTINDEIELQEEENSDDEEAWWLKLPRLENRLDFQLKESRYESSYVSALTSHTSYWTNQDMAMFLMSELFADYGPIGIPKK